MKKFLTFPAACLSLLLPAAAFPADPPGPAGSQGSPTVIAEAHDASPIAPPADLPRLQGPPPGTSPPPPPSPPPPQSGQWIETQQYGRVWMPYADDYTYLPPDGYGEPYAYVYRPAVGWTWVVAPWIWGWGPWPLFGSYGPYHYGWYGRGYWRNPGRWHYAPAYRGYAPGPRYFGPRGVAPRSFAAPGHRPGR
jgi:hypothetical protein